MSGRSEAVVRSLGFLFTEGTHCGLTDAELLERFVSRPDDAAAHAFESLVLRHGPMVFDVCNRVLGNLHDAQDAFQATFLVLATRARSIQRQKSVGSWLHGVALRVARRARSDAVRRTAHERRIAEMTSQEVVSEAMADGSDFRVLHEEVDRLPRKYREPVVLCYLEGMTLETAAGQLGCPISTLGVRLMRAREHLKTRLSRRGLSRADGLLAAGPAARSALAALPNSLVKSTVGAAIQMTSGGVVPLAAAQLTNEMLRNMAMTRLTQVLGIILVVTIGVTSLGAALARHEQAVAVKPASQPAGQAPEDWIGKKVVITYADRFMGTDLADIEEVLSVYMVDRVDGDQVKLALKGAGDRWNKVTEVVLLDRALDFYTEAIQQNGKSLAARLRRAQIWESQGKRVEAIADLTEALRIGPPNAVVYSVRGNMLRDESELDKAIADFSEAIKLDPKHLWAYLSRGWIWSHNRDYDKAIADYSEAVRLSPKNAAAYCERGIAWTAKQELDRAMADLDEAIRLNPNLPLAYATRGEVWLAKNDYDKAIADQNEAIRLAPQFIFAHYQRGITRFAMKDFDAAVADLSECIRLDPGDARFIHISRGFAWYGKGENDKAIADFDEAIRLGAKTVALHRFRGLAFKAKGNYGNAIAAFDEAIRLDPKNPQVYSDRAWIWAACPDVNFRDGKRAIESATKACDLTAWKDPVHLTALAAGYSEMHDFDSAVKWQTEANALSTDESSKKTGEALLKSYMELLRIEQETKAELLRIQQETKALAR